MTLFCRLHSLKLTAKGPENQWLQYDLGMVAIFRGHVSFIGGNAGEKIQVVYLRVIPTKEINRISSPPRF